jgi:thiamine transporter ThiT
MVSKIVVTIFLLSLIVAPFAGLAPLMFVGLILGIFSIAESIVYIIWPGQIVVAKERETQNTLS